jgi:hypothetical protein
MIPSLTNGFDKVAEEYEEYDGRDSPQAPPALLRRLLRGPLGIVGVKGRQELGTRPGNRIHRSKDGIGPARGTKNIGSHAEYMIPSLTTQALVFRSRRRPYANMLDPRNDISLGAAIYRGNCSWPIKLWHLESENHPIRKILDPTRDRGFPA